MLAGQSTQRVLCCMHQCRSKCVLVRHLGRAKKIEEPRFGHRGSYPFKEGSCSASARTTAYPLLDLVRVPCHSASPESYPLRKFLGGLQSGDVCETIRNAIDSFQFLLRYELPCHCKSLL